MFQHLHEVIVKFNIIVMASERCQSIVHFFNTHFHFENIP